LGGAKEEEKGEKVHYNAHEMGCFGRKCIIMHFLGDEKSGKTNKDQELLTQRG
jgi:hypothetical protein